MLNKFFPIVDTCLSCKDIARQSCAMVPRWRFSAVNKHSDSDFLCYQSHSPIVAEFRDIRLPLTYEIGLGLLRFVQTGVTGCSALRCSAARCVVYAAA